MINPFTHNSPYKKRARLIAILWTLLIFIACLTPKKEIPDIPVPFIDKWVHFLLFGIFSFLWLCAFPSRKSYVLIYIFMAAAFLAWLTETLQGLFPSLHRTKDIMDMLADAVGGILGIIAFYILSLRVEKKALNK